VAHYQGFLFPSPPYHVNGTTAAAPTTKPVDVTRSGDGRTYATYLKIKNSGVANSLLVSFDGGTNFFTLAVGEDLEVSSQVFSVVVKASAATADYSIVCVASR
jgi:hypothetical protein